MNRQPGDTCVYTGCDGQLVVVTRITRRILVCNTCNNAHGPAERQNA